MPKKIVFTDDQINDIRDLVESGATQIQIAEQFGTTDTVIRGVCKANGISTQSMRAYTCVVCGQEFRASHKSAICDTCRSTPAVCVICGKEFKRSYPYTQKTCSPECRGKYRAQSGIAKEGAAKMRQSKLERYGTLDPSVIAVAKNGEISKRICPLCGREFQPTAVRQIYCEDKHYGPCPVCGKLTEIKDYSIGVQACSEECRIARINATCLERYGNKDAVNSEHAKELAKKHSLERYGTEYYMQSEEGKARYKQVIRDKYGFDNTLQVPEFREKGKQTNLAKYGTEWASQSDEVKSRIKSTQEARYGGMGVASPQLRKKIEETNQNRHGYSLPFNSKEVQDKIHEDSLLKNGTPWPACSDESNEKRKSTNIDRYGCENPLGNKDIQERIHELWTEKYGGPNPMYSPDMARYASESQQKAMLEKYGVNCSVKVPEIREKIIATNMERYGVPWYWFSPDIASSTGHISENNKRFGKWLENIGLQYEFELVIEDRQFDIHILDSNLLIEVDPTVTHNIVMSPWTPDKGLDPRYHLMKSEVAWRNGYKCIHIFDWDNYLGLVSMLTKKQKIHARACEIHSIDRVTAQQFTQKYHLQGSCKGQSICYGLYYNGELVQVMTFGKSRYNKNYDFELLRLCSKNDVRVVGGPSKLFSQFVKSNPNKSVLSYCDLSKFSGEVYEAIGMRLDHLSPPAKVWSKGNRYITDNYLRQHGFDRIFHTNYGKGTSNEQLMLDSGWLPVCDCGQKVFTYVPN